MKNSKIKALTLAVALSVTAALAACGGGGGGSNDTTSSNGPAGGDNSVPPTQAVSSYTVAGNIGSVVGMDSKGRGYRDDVAQLIADKYSTDPVVQSAAEDAAKSYQQSLGLVLSTVTDTTSYIQDDAKRGACAVYKAANATEGKLVIEAMDAIYARSFNTPDRIAQRKAFMAKAPSVLSISIPQDAAHC